MTGATLLAPRVALHPAGSPPDSLQAGWISLPVLTPTLSDEFVFGDGSHPTTRLCAGVIDSICCRQQPESMLDVGTGTGVLARIARQRGVPLVWATDIHAGALASARRHAALDDHAVPIHLSQGAPDSLGVRFDLIVANILEGPLQVMAAALFRALQPGGTLVLSGFTGMQVPALRVRYERLGMTFSARSVLEEWALLVLRRDSC